MNVHLHNKSFMYIRRQTHLFMYYKCIVCYCFSSYCHASCVKREGERNVLSKVMFVKRQDNW